MSALWRAILLMGLTIWYTRIGHDTLIVQRSYLWQVGPELVLAAGVILLFWSPRLGERSLRAQNLTPARWRRRWITWYILPALMIILLPVGFFTYYLGVNHPLSFLDYPIAKTVASVWLGLTLANGFGLWQEM